jgi:hypothetical protein
MLLNSIHQVHWWLPLSVCTYIGNSRPSVTRILPLRGRAMAGCGDLLVEPGIIAETVREPLPERVLYPADFPSPGVCAGFDGNHIEAAGKQRQARLAGNEETGGTANAGLFPGSYAGQRAAEALTAPIAHFDENEAFIAVQGNQVDLPEPAIEISAQDSQPALLQIARGALLGMDAGQAPGGMIQN